METFRISDKRFSSSLSCSGKPNRWNKDKQMVLYVGSSRSLSALEMVVHRNSIQPNENYEVMIVSINDEEDLFDQLLIKDLPANWRSIKAYPDLQKLGSEWYNSKRSLILKVPSVVITQEYNYIINTEHPDFNSKVRHIRTEEFFWDMRFLK